MAAVSDSTARGPICAEIGAEQAESTVFQARYGPSGNRTRSSSFSGACSTHCNT